MAYSASAWESETTPESDPESLKISQNLRKSCFVTIKPSSRIL